MFIERDPRNKIMQAELFSRMNDIINAVDPIPNNEKEVVNNVTFVDVEAAARELLAMGVRG